MLFHCPQRLKTALTAAALLSALPGLAAAQVTPAAGYTPPDDTPSVRVGVTIFGNYTEQTSPAITDTDGNSVKKGSFDVARSYINVTGNISHVVAFRVTPDITRETNTASSLSGSLVFRVKYAYLQTNLVSSIPGVAAHTDPGVLREYRPRPSQM